MTAVALEVVVIGSGRSGTAWAAEHLTAAGVTCGHESVLDWHATSRPDRRLGYPGRTPSPHEPAPGAPLRAESSLAAIAYLAVVPPTVRVWHVAREPRSTARSWAASGILDDPTAPYGRFALAHVPPMALEPTPLGRALRWVAEWNLRGAGAAWALDLDYRLDRLEDVAEGRVNPHGPDAPPPGWDEIRGACRAETFEFVTWWAAIAGYPGP